MNKHFLSGALIGSFITGLGITHDPGWIFLGAVSLVVVGLVLFIRG